MSEKQQPKFFINTRTSNEVDLMILNGYTPNVISYDRSSFYFPTFKKEKFWCKLSTNSTRVASPQPTASMEQESELVPEKFYSSEPLASCYTVNEGFAAMATEEGQLTVLDADTKQVLYSKQLHQLPMRRKSNSNQVLIRRSPLGDLFLLVARNNNTFEMFELKVEGDKKMVEASAQPQQSGRSCVNCITVTNDGWFLAVCNSDNFTRIHRFNIQSKAYDKIVNQIPGNSYGASFNCNGKLLAVVTDEYPSLVIHNLEKGSTIRMSHIKMQGMELIPTVHFSPVNPNLLCYADHRLMVILIDPANDTAQHFIVKAAPSQLGCYFSRDGKYLFVGRTSVEVMELDKQFYATQGRAMFNTTPVGKFGPYHDIKIEHC